MLSGLAGIRRRWLRGLLLRYAGGIVAISQDSVDQLRLPPERCRIVCDFVDFSVFDWHLDKAACRRQLGIPADRHVTLFAGGSIVAIKGREDYLTAMAALVPEIPGLLCLMPSFNPDEFRNAGKAAPPFHPNRVLGLYRKKQRRLDALLDRNDLRKRVIHTAFRFDIETFIAASDVICVPHTKPHCSLTVNQAGAMKRPVVAYRIGGVEEMVRDGENGLLVETGDIPGLAAAVRRLLQDPALAARLAEGGYRQAVERFDARKEVPRILELIRTVMK